jgi:hypothetical protein
MNQSTFEKKVIPWIVVLWFLVTIDSFFLWWSFGRIFRFLALLGMLYSTLLLSNRFRTTTYNLPIIFSLLIYIFWLLPFFHNPVLVLIKIFDFSTFLLLLFWPKETLANCYKLLRKVIIFFAIGSSIVSILSLIGVLQYLPHFTLEARSSLHKDRGVLYYVYGAFVTMNGAARACGPVQEPGHWAIIMGLFYLIDRFALQKRSFWMILGGVLTFSSAFLLMFLVVESLNLFTKTSFKKTKQLLFIIFSVFLIYLVLPQNIKNEVTYLFFERNLESVYENYSENESLTDALDARANDYSIDLYYNLSPREFWFGRGYRDTTAAISDHRGTILFIGLIGLVLSIIPSVLILLKAKWRLFIALGVSLFLVYIHRGWMFYAPYIYFLAFMAVTLSSMPIPEYDKYVIEETEDNNNDTLILEKL